MFKATTVKVKQPQIEQLHDNVDWVLTGLAKVRERAERLGDETILELLNDVTADVDHLKAGLPARQLKLLF